MKMQKGIPAGIIDGGTEFFTAPGINGPELMAFHGSKIYSYDDLPGSTKTLVYVHMKSQPMVDAELTKMVGNDEVAKLKQFIMCRFGAMNSEADVTSCGKMSEPEYVPCLNRGNCKFEGRVCASITVNNGLPLSKSESAVFKLIHLPAKDIAERLFVSLETIKSHINNIRIKTGLANKTEMAVWATKHGVI